MKISVTAVGIGNNDSQARMMRLRERIARDLVPMRGQHGDAAEQSPRDARILDVRRDGSVRRVPLRSA